jgi:hypothetical protein
MAGQFRMSFVSDVREFLTGTSNVEDALDDVAGELDDVAREAQDAGRDISDALTDAARDGRDAGRDISDAGRDISDALTDAARDGRDAGRDISDAFTDAGRDVSRSMDDAGDESISAVDRISRSFRDLVTEARDTGRDVSRSISAGVNDAATRTRDGADDMKDSLREVGDSARETSGEMATSFDGSMDGLVDGFSEVAAEAGFAFGPAGGIIGLVAAAAAAKSWSDLSASAEATKERVSSAFQAMTESGNDFLTAADVNARAMEIYADATEELTTAEEIATQTGLSRGIAVRALAGDVDALAAVERALADIESEAQAEKRRLTRGINDHSDGVDKNTGELRVNLEAQNQTINRSRTLAREIDRVRGETDQAARQFREYTSAKRDANRGDVTTDIRTTGKARSIDDIRDVLGAGRPIPIPLYVPQKSINDIYNTVAGIRLPALQVQVRYGQAAV